MPASGYKTDSSKNPFHLFYPNGPRRLPERAGGIDCRNTVNAFVFYINAVSRLPGKSQYPAILIHNITCG